MKIDLSCPAEVLRAEPPKEDQPFAVLTLFNLSDRSIVSAEATVRLTDREGKETGRAVHRARALNGRPHTAFTMTVPFEGKTGAFRAEASLDKIWFEDNDVWRRAPDNEIEYESNVLPPSPALNALKFAAGENAVGFPSQQPRLWLCVCGRPNDNNSTVCARCRRQKDLIFSRYNRMEVEKNLAQRERQLDLKSRSAREEDIRLQRIREEEYHLRKQRVVRRWRLLVSFVCALALTAAMAFAVVPALRLYSANALMNRDQYEEALAVFTDLGEFPGASAARQDCENRIARRDASASRDPDTLAAAAAHLRKNGEGEPDRSLANDADYRRAGLLLEAGETEAAEALLRSLPEAYPGRETQLNACAYAKADAAMLARDYDTARELFLSLADYADAATRAAACLYEQALARMESGEYDEAVSLLSQIPDYEDSRTLIQKSWYLKGFVLENEGNPEAAREAYLAAGNYEDAAERASAIQMTWADAFLAAKDVESALPLYQALDGYADAREKWISCAVTLATRHYKKKDYASAIALLDALPEQTSESETLRTRSIDRAARAAAKEGAYEEAIALIARIPDYRDDANLLRSWKYTLAESWMKAERWEDVIPLLEELGSYRNAARWLEQAREATAAPAAEEDADGN